MTQATKFIKDFDQIIIFFLFISFLISDLVTYSILNLNLSLFDLIALIMLIRIFFKENKIIRKKELLFLFLINIYLIIHVFVDISLNFNSYNFFLIKKKTTLVLQFFRSSVIFLFIYNYLSSNNNKDFYKNLIDIFILYCLLIFSIYIFDLFIGTNIVSAKYDILRLRGFFRDPNFLSFFIAFILILCALKRESILKILFLSLIGILSQSKTFFIFFLIFLFYIIFKYRFKLKSKFENLYFRLLIIINFSYLAYIVFDTTSYLMGYSKQAVMRYYSLFKYFDHPRFKMLKDNLYIDSGIIFGKGSYSITKKSFTKYDNYLHNSFIEFYYDFGIFGLIIFFSFIYTVLQKNNFFIIDIFLKIIILFFLAIYLFNFTIIYLPYIWFVCAAFLLANKEVSHSNNVK